MSEPRNSLEKFLYHNILTIILVALGLGTIGVGNVVEAIDKTLVFFHVKPNALEIARDDERSKFSRDLMRLLWRRLAAMDKYRVKATDESFSQAERDSAWQGYVSVFDEWQGELMLNIISLKKYYGDEKSSVFEGETAEILEDKTAGIQGHFNLYHNCLERIRTKNSDFQCKAVEIDQNGDLTERSLCKLETMAKIINGNIYCFITGLPKDKATDCYSSLDAKALDERSLMSKSKLCTNSLK
jgi:hypothetical protein